MPKQACPSGPSPSSCKRLLLPDALRIAGAPGTNLFRSFPRVGAVKKRGPWRWRTEREPRTLSKPTFQRLPWLPTGKTNQPANQSTNQPINRPSEFAMGILGQIKKNSQSVGLWQRAGISNPRSSMLYVGTRKKGLEFSLGTQKLGFCPQIQVENSGWNSGVNLPKKGDWRHALEMT